MFAPKGKQRAAAGTEPGKHNARESELQRFHSELSKAKPIAMEKYFAIKDLPKRNAGKTQLLHELEEMLKTDPKCTSSYWSMAVTRKRTIGTEAKGKWLLRERVDVMLGGKDATERAIKAGKYDTRTYKKNGVVLQEVRYHEDIERDISENTAEGRLTGEEDMAADELKQSAQTILNTLERNSQVELHQTHRRCTASWTRDKKI